MRSLLTIIACSFHVVPYCMYASLDNSAPLGSDAVSLAQEVSPSKPPVAVLSSPALGGQAPSKPVFEPLDLDLEEEPLPAAFLQGPEYLSSRSLSDQDRSIPWRYREYNASAEDEKLLEFLQSFCRTQKVPVKFYTDLSAIIVSGDFKDIKPQMFLDRLVEAYGLTWFFDGNMLHIDSQDNMESLYLNLKTGRSADRLRYLINTMGLKASNYTIRFLENNNMFYISGPKQFVANIEELVDKENSVEQQVQSETTVRIFPLKHAYAQDITVNYNQETITIPGVATTLQELMSNLDDNSEFVMNSKASQPRSKKLKGQGLGRQNPKDAASLDKNKEDDESAQAKAGAKKDSSFVAQRKNVLIRPDVRNNAVIIRDSLEQMPVYEAIIEQLDQPQQVITITAAIVDISSAYTRDFGVNFFDWKKVDGRGQLSVGPSGASALPTDGFNLAGRILSNNDEFLGRVQALEQENHAKVLARPSVVTFNNMEAVISQDETFYVRVNGDREVDLFDVHAGTVLKVTPSIVGQGEGKDPRIRLLISIEDGSSSSSTQVDNIPRTQKSFINTQAIVGQNQSLLVGGYFRENNSEDESGIPILKDIPIIGMAFKKKVHKKGTVERMFLISPKIVALEDLHNKELDGYIKKEDPFKLMKAKPALQDRAHVSRAGKRHSAELEADPVMAEDIGALDEASWLDFDSNPQVRSDMEGAYRSDSQKRVRQAQQGLGAQVAVSKEALNDSIDNDPFSIEMMSDDPVFNEDTADPALNALYKAQNAFLLKSRLAYRFRGKSYRVAAIAPSCSVF